MKLLYAHAKHARKFYSHFGVVRPMYTKNLEREVKGTKTWLHTRGLGEEMLPPRRAQKKMFMECCYTHLTVFRVLYYQADCLCSKSTSRPCRCNFHSWIEIGLVSMLPPPPPPPSPESTVQSWGEKIVCVLWGWPWGVKPPSPPGSATVYLFLLCLAAFLLRVPCTQKT